MEFNGLAGQMRYFALQGSGYDGVQDECPDTGGKIRTAVRRTMMPLSCKRHAHFLQYTWAALRSHFFCMYPLFAMQYLQYACSESRFAQK